jgi:hypothetical protein
MTNLQQLIERRRGGGSDKLDHTIQIHDESDIHRTSYNLHKKLRDLIESEITQTATLSYRQALEDVLEFCNKEHSESYGETAKTYETVREQIEGLLGNIKDI